jgi:hypothetical protein
MTYALRETRDLAPSALPARMARIIALMALAALGLPANPFHEPFHALRRRLRLCLYRESIDF